MVFEPERRLELSQTRRVSAQLPAVALAAAGTLSSRSASALAEMRDQAPSGLFHQIQHLFKA